MKLFVFLKNNNPPKNKTKTKAKQKTHKKPNNNKTTYIKKNKKNETNKNKKAKQQPHSQQKKHPYERNKAKEKLKLNTTSFSPRECSHYSSQMPLFKTIYFIKQFCFSFKKEEIQMA